MSFGGYEMKKIFEIPDFELSKILLRDILTWSPELDETEEDEEESDSDNV